MRTTTRVPAGNAEQSGGAWPSMFHNVTALTTSPMSGSASKVTSANAIDRFHPPTGSVKAIRQDKYATSANTATTPPMCASRRDSAGSADGVRSSEAHAAIDDGGAAGGSPGRAVGA